VTTINYPQWNCPCATYIGPPPPTFVGDHYYHETGNVEMYELTQYCLQDPLWDGAVSGTGICICKNGHHNDEDIAVKKIQLYTM